MKEMKMDISKSDLLKMLSAYYSKELGTTVVVKAELHRVPIGYRDDDYENQIEFSYTQTITYGESTITVTTVLSEEDIKEVLGKILGELNYSVEQVKYKTDFKYTGYGRDEHAEYYFDGVTIKVTPKGFERKMERR